MADEPREEVLMSGGLRLHRHRWAPEGPPKAEVILLHGYGEHAGRYAAAASVWNGRGIGVTSADLRGHGRSAGGRGAVVRFEDYHEDVKAIFASVPGSDAPRFLFGHSMGGLLALHHLGRWGASGLRGLVLSSPFLGLAVQASPIKLAAGRMLSRWFPRFPMPTGLTGFDVARDPDIARTYENDPLNNKNATVRWFTEATRAIDDVFRGAAQHKLTTLLMFATGDRVALGDATERWLTAVPSGVVETERLTVAHHEILNEPEPERTQIAHRMGDWILERAG